MLVFDERLWNYFELFHKFPALRNIHIPQSRKVEAFGWAHHHIDLREFERGSGIPFFSLKFISDERQLYGRENFVVFRLRGYLHAPWLKTVQGRELGAEIIILARHGTIVVVDDSEERAIYEAQQRDRASMFAARPDALHELERNDGRAIHQTQGVLSSTAEGRAGSLYGASGGKRGPATRSARGRARG